MKLKRHLLKYLIIYYLPSGLFVVVSWVSFLIPPDVVPGRSTTTMMASEGQFFCCFIFD